jgi:hypothetical protein
VTPWDGIFAIMSLSVGRADMSDGLVCISSRQHAAGAGRERCKPARVEKKSFVLVRAGNTCNLGGKKQEAEAFREREQSFKR